MRAWWAPAGALALLAVAIVAMDARPSVAKPEYTRRTKKECLFCHPKGSYTLTEAGKYYRDHKYSLEGYKPKASR